jgi:hypothetical protein
MRSSKRVRLGEPALLALCLLGLLSAPAWAAESPPSPEPAPPSAAASAGAESPAPESVPQASAPAPTGSSQAASPAAGGEGAPPRSTPSGPAGGRTRSKHGAPTPHRSSQRPAQAPRAGKRATAHSGPSAIAVAGASAVSSHRNGTLMLLASLALGLLALAAATLMRLLIRLGRLSDGRLAT